ncbi:MAG TPA: tRNA pseudouridine synthase A [Saprospiraceae bacterium]|nr:tRNA pseudouridine synthase A [Saprospiraceae bacterium]HND89794.1 tRNA pseudouridine synthase A [Saprospiraceae bacterium]HNG89898.1 tRNA pseudouridine synthase A [Saprospiraceae bacterium]
MPRHFLSLAYLGTRYSGWQVQPNAASVQGQLETALSTLLRQPISVTGCGRTDAGVHARHYVAHFDAQGDLPPTFLIQVNGLLPHDVAVQDCWPVAPEAHARFDALQRSYEYHISLRKDPFSAQTAWFFHQHHRADWAAVQEAADVMSRFSAFFPFCKTHSDAEHYDCRMYAANWVLLPAEGRWVFQVSANRFLRGMVRLMVGACLHVGLGKLSLDALRHALDTQTPLPRNWSVPAHGLSLTGVRYV